MFIAGADRTFEVTKTIERNSCYTVYLGKNMTDVEDETIYEITCYKKGSEMKQVIPVFTEMRKNRQFRDYITCFSRNGAFYVVFRHYEGEQLKAQIRDFYYSFKEKLTIMKNLYENIILLNIPELILYQALQKDNLFLTDTLEIQFNYAMQDFKKLETSEDVTTDAVNMAHEQFVSVFKELFAVEMNEKYSEEFNEYYLRIKDNTYEDYKAEYRAYMQIYEELSAAYERGELKSNSKKKKLKVWLGERTPQIKTVLMTVVLAAAVLVLMFIPLDNQDKSGVKFSYIGTQEIMMQR